MKKMNGLYIVYAFLCKINYFIAKFLSRVAALFIIIMSIIIFAQVIMRYIFSKPFEWAEELTIYMMVYMMLICIPYLIIMNKNIAMTIFYEKIAGKRLGFLFDIVIHGSFLTIVFLWLPLGINLFLDSRDILAAQMSITRDWLYSSIPISFGVTIIICMQKIIRSLVCFIQGTVNTTFLEIEEKYEKSEKKIYEIE